MFQILSFDSLVKKRVDRQKYMTNKYCINKQADEKRLYPYIVGYSTVHGYTVVQIPQHIVLYASAYVTWKPTNIVHMEKVHECKKTHKEKQMSITQGWECALSLIPSFALSLFTLSLKIALLKEQT